MRTGAPPTTLVPTVKPGWTQIAVVATGLTILIARPDIVGALGWSWPVVVGVFSLILILSAAAIPTI